MGGARCSYRDCTQRSDQVTHMFHYPVFDKVRCHQWITNAQKLNFLDLKLSQLKNRLICQHHFTDDSFMNSLKNKLKNTAVPTLNGPYCSTSQDELSKQGESHREKELPINIEDIENEFLPQMEKRNHLSVKYGDFLTNDVSDNITLSPKNKSTSIVVQDTGVIFNRFSIPRSLTGRAKMNLVFNKGAKEKKQRLFAHSKNDLPQLVSNQELTPVIYHEPNVIQQETPNINPEYVIQTSQADTKQTSLHTQKKQILSAQQKKPSSSTIPITKRVQIISEKSISEPLIICKGELQPVSPSIVINVPRKKEQKNFEINGHKVQTIFMDNVSQSQISQQLNNSREGLSQVGDSYELNRDVQTDRCTHVMPCTKSEDSREKVDIVKPLENFDLKDGQVKQEGEMLTSNHQVLTPASSDWTMINLTGPPVLSYISMPQVSSVDNTSYIHSMSEASTGLQNTCVPYSEQLPPESSLQKQPQHSTVQATATSEMPRNIENNDSQKQITTKITPAKSIKNIIPPEKLAEIEEKRKYNMKLRDIIDSCLNNIDEEPEAVKLNAIKKKELNNKKVGEHLANVSKQDNNIAYLEARLQRLEDTLLNKIELNSQKITDLKRTIKVNTTKKAVSTQTYQTAEATKRSLYQQISQYLSPDANSLIYEELFINSCIYKPMETPRKRRRRI